MKKERIAIIGSGDLGKSIAHYAINNAYNVVGYYDDFQKDEVGGIPILGKQDSILKDYKNHLFDALVCAVGYNHFCFREYVFNKYHCEEGIPFATIIDESCHIDPTAIIGKGVVMFPAVLVDKGCVIKNNVLLNVGVTIAHDSCVEEHSFLSPRAAIAGFSTVGKRCMIGINSTVIDNISICDDVRLGGGAVLIDNVLRKGLYVGVPAKFVKE